MHLDSGASRNLRLVNEIDSRLASFTSNYYIWLKWQEACFGSKVFGVQSPAIAMLTLSLLTDLPTDCSSKIGLEQWHRFERNNNNY